jgi:hypothetical protein
VAVSVPAEARTVLGAVIEGAADPAGPVSRLVALELLAEVLLEPVELEPELPEEPHPPTASASKGVRHESARRGVIARRRALIRSSALNGLRRSEPLQALRDPFPVFCAVARGCAPSGRGPAARALRV